MFPFSFFTFFCKESDIFSPPKLCFYVVLLIIQYDSAAALPTGTIGSTASRATTEDSFVYIIELE